MLRGAVFCCKGQKVWGTFDSKRKIGKDFTHAGRGSSNAGSRSTCRTNRQATRNSLTPTTHPTKPAQKHLSVNSAIFLLNISVPAERSRSLVAELDGDVQSTFSVISPSVKSAGKRVQILMQHAPRCPLALPSLGKI